MSIDGEKRRLRQRLDVLRAAVDCIERGLDMDSFVSEAAHSALQAAGNVLSSAARYDLTLYKDGR